MTQILSILAIGLTVAIVIVAIQLIKADKQQSPPQQQQQAAGGEYTNSAIGGKFSAIVLNAPVNVVYTNSSAFSISGDLSAYNVKVENGTLTIASKTANTVSNGNLPAIKISHTGLSVVTVSGIGSFTADTISSPTQSVILNATGIGGIKISKISCSSLCANATGIGDITVSGTADTAALTSIGIGKINADGLKVKNGTTNISGLGNIFSNINFTTP